MVGAILSGRRGDEVLEGGGEGAARREVLGESVGFAAEELDFVG